MNTNRAQVEGMAKLSLVELILSYRIPLIESAISIVACVSGISILTIIFPTIGLNIDIGDPLYNGAETVLEYQRIISERATISYALALSNCWTFFTIFGPLFFAFTFGGTFEDGTLRTLLTYPVRRTVLVIVKMVVFVIVVSVPMIIIPLLWIAILLPSEAVVLHLSITCVSAVLSAALIAATSILVSVSSKNASATAVTGVLLWTGLSYLTSLPDVPVLLLMLCNPIRMASRYATGLYPDMMYWELLLLLLGSLAVVVVLLVIGVSVFRRQDV